VLNFSPSSISKHNWLCLLLVCQFWLEGGFLTKEELRQDPLGLAVDSCLEKLHSHERADFSEQLPGNFDAYDANSDDLIDNAELKTGGEWGAWRNFRRTINSDRQSHIFVTEERVISHLNLRRKNDTMGYS
jgi:hypothetical protein